jgi:hypothetical protein
MRQRVLHALVFGLLVLGTAPARADYAALEFKNTVVDYTNGNWSLGWRFTVTDTVVASALGFYDDKGDGFKSSHAVGIFKDAGTLIGWTTVTNADPLDGHFRYHSIPGLLLQAGQTYRIAGTTGSDNYTWWPTGASTDPRVKYLNDVYTYSNSLVYPVETVGYTDLNAAGWFGPDFKLAGGASIQGGSTPEPGSLTLLGLGALGLGGIAWRRRRRESTEEPPPSESEA